MPTGQITTRALIALPTLAERLRVNEHQIRRLVAENRIPSKWGHLVRFDPDEVDGWLQRARVPAHR